MRKTLTYPLIVLAYLVFDLCVHAHRTYAQVRADFSANTTAGCAPLVVQFSDESTGQPTSWRWDLGNGTISLFEDPSTIYFLPGTYAVKLVVKNASGADSLVKQQFITVFENPVPGFAASDTVGCFPLLVQFTDTSSVSGSNISDWHWDFGDGRTSRLQHPAYTYTDSGKHTVTLKVTTDRGCTQTISKAQYIQISSGVVAGFSDSMEKTCTAPAAVHFTNTSTGPGAMSWEWDFGDGTRSALQHPVHTYTANGSYTVSLVAISSAGCRDTIRKNGLVNVGVMQTRFDVPDSVCAGRPLSITNSSLPVPVSAWWDFGDGSTSGQLHPQKNYPASGTFTIKLVNTYASCIDSISKTIHVVDPPVASFTSDRQYACTAPASVSFTSGTTARSYYWDFGDGTFSTAKAPVHTYTATGVYSVKLVVTGAGGCSDSLIKKDFIHVQRPRVQINGAPASGCLPLTVPLSATIAAPEQITSWHWDFGDGTTSASATPVKTYQSEGTWSIKLVIVTAGGCTDSVLLTDAIRASEKPQVSFSATPLDLCASNAVSFTNASSPSGTSWQWLFGDGGTSAAENPAHKYRDTGYFNVTLITWNNECSDTLEKERFIYVRSPVARFRTEMRCDDKYLRTFTNTSIGAQTSFWDFGDGTTSTAFSPQHRYAAKGTYRVKLVVQNGFCKDSLFSVVNIADEHLDFSASATEVCRGLPVTYTLQHYDPQYTAQVRWNFGDGAVATQAPSTAHTYKNTGEYDVQLYFTDVNGCADSVKKDQYVRVYGPRAGFAPQQPVICTGATAVFTDQSNSDGIHPISQWHWQYGDGSAETLVSAPFAHTYAHAGRYNVTLKVTDSYGCADSITRNAVVTVSQPVAAFVSADTSSCPGKPVAFANASAGSSLQYHWDFGDGTTAAAASPVHRYTDTGMYSVRLRIVDAYGCSDSLVRVNYIRIMIPVASFDVSDSISSCPPLQVRFTSHARNYSTLKWDFGDGSVSALESPEHFYNYPGTYYVKQIIRGPGGCEDTAVRKLVVKGPQGSFTYAPLTGCKPLRVMLHATSANNVSFVWDFNDGTVLPSPDRDAQHTYTSAGNFVPKMILVDSAGCRVPIVGKDTLKVIGVTAGAAMDEYRVCDSGFVQFTDQSVANDFITNHEWRFGTGVTSALPHPRYKYTSAGEYTVTHIVTTSQGCKDTIAFADTVKVWQTPRAIIHGGSEACVNAVLKFSPQVVAGDSAALEWHWDFDNGNSAYVPQADSQTYRSAGNYRVALAISYKDFCRDTALHPVLIHPLPATNGGPDTVVCRDQPVQLHASGADRYTWQPAPGISCTDCDAPFVNPANDVAYIVTGYSNAGCTRDDTVHVRVRQRFTLVAGEGDTICKGQILQLTASGPELFEWSPAAGLDNPHAASPKAFPAQTTTYTVVGSDPDGCFYDTARVPVVVYPVPSVFAGNDTTVTTGSTITLHAQTSADVTKLIWTPAAGLSCRDCPDPTVRVKNSVTYWVQVSNEGGCIASDPVTIQAVCNTGNWFIPNTFSPNGDGMNDVFYVRGNGLNRIHSLRIFNRWGQVVFERRDIAASDPSGGWDGTVNGKKVDPDVYVYIAEFICDNSAIVPVKGNVALIR